MNIRAEFVPKGSLRLDLGHLGTLTEQLNVSGPVVKWQELFKAMYYNDIQGITIGTDGAVTITPEWN